jgi:O-methyltransferase involved in polyketide biosynthesis
LLAAQPGAGDILRPLVDQLGASRTGTESMAITLPAFTPVEDSLFLTLYSRALDNRLSKPILSDATADEIVRNLDDDFEQFKVNKNHSQRRTPSQKAR